MNYQQPAHSFKTKVQLKFRDADPAQIMYFANIYSLAHDAFEEFIVAAGYKYSDWFTKKLHIVPIRHCEADYLNPLLPGSTYQIDVSVQQCRETSFQMKYVFSAHGKIHAIVKMVHVVLNPETKQKMDLPPNLKTKLLPFLEPQPSSTTGA